MQIPVTTSGRIHPYHPNMRPRLSLNAAGSRTYSVAFLLVIVAIAVSAQEPNRVPYSCAEEDLQWAGMSCGNEPCAIYLELNSVAPDGKKIFAAGDLHSSSATLGSILLVSDDSGATWKEPAARMRGSALDQLQFYNLQTGWAAGETQYPLARDPFVLVTTDGGASWLERPVGEEGGAGLVQHFWFDSAQHGELIVDAGKSSAAGRYLSYESETGGESWMLTGKSRQLPKLRHAPPSSEDADWRVRPSKDGKAFQIEQRAGGQWTPVASFLIEVANCRTGSEELKEPAPQ
jgi:photosystem II stability/assembly factor-like uncharacterized protein